MTKFMILVRKPKNWLSCIQSLNDWEIMLTTGLVCLFSNENWRKKWNDCVFFQYFFAL